MKIMQVGLAEARDLHSQAAGSARLAQLLGALHAYAGGSRQEVGDYLQVYPFSRLKDVWTVQPAAPVKSEPTPVADGFRRYEFSDGSSNKFWEVACSENQQTVRFGRIGTAGQAKTKSFGSPAEAQSDTNKLIAEKVAKGYKPA